VSGLFALAKPYRIKAAHRRRRKVASGQSVQRYYDPGIGRFLSVDPVTANSGTGANFNRYWYANNNPYKFTDPDGRNSIITHMKDGSVNIAVPVNFSGPGATTQNITAVKADISSKWSGTYNINGKATQVNVQVTNADANTPAKAINNIQLTTGPTSDVNSQGSSFVRGGNSGEWNMNSSGMQNGEAAHEGGHLMRAGDKYASSLDANGKRVTTPHTGFSGNVMGETKAGTTTNDTNMREIMTSKQNIHRKEK